MNGLISRITLLLLVMFGILTPRNADAAYIVYTCRVAYTNSGGGWVEQTNCWIDRVVGKPFPQEAYDHEYNYLPPIYWMLNADGTKTEIPSDKVKNKVQQCLDDSFEQLKLCKTWVGIGAIGGRTACALLARRAGQIAYGICDGAVSGGGNEAFLQCDSNARARDSKCTPTGMPSP